ncbi:MAG: redoxin family protein [Bacteroidales bacterium]|nr:redoxin family protein [Bacteroidales bacterium]
MNKIFLTFIISFLQLSLWGQSDTIYIRKVYDNLKQIQSASYFWYQSASSLYDTIPSRSYSVFKKEFDNQEDKFVGASIASFQLSDTTKMIYFYDGNVQSYLDWENKIIPVDSFQNNRYPFRTVYPPFLTHVKSLLKYALETSDNKIIHVKDLADSVLISLSFYDTLVEVVGNWIVYADPPNLMEDKWSKYEIWISKVNNLPYRITKKFPDRITWETCKEIRINKTDKINFIASKYFPTDFVIKSNESNSNKEKNLIGTVAPSWELKDTNNNSIGLGDVKSKVIIIQFTGIGCGPCYQSIPYLIKIKNQYKDQELEIISIETWNNNLSVIKKHVLSYHISYKYLVCNNEVKLKYGIQSVPKFFVLDKNRVIKKIITGFDKEKTYVELKDTIDQLVNK